MIVCPNCRNANDEEEVVCARCGGSLEPGPTQLATRRAPSERPPIEIAEPKPPSPWRAVVAIGVVLGVALGVGAWYLLRSDPCAGTNFTSTQFGYCLTLPENWEWQPAKFGDAVTVDQFSPPTQSATVLVEAADLPDNADLSAFADAIRQKDRDAGLTPGPIERTTVDDADALAWEIDYTSDTGTDFGVREIVVVNDHFGWRLMLNDTAEAFEATASTFDAMIRSFRFR